jgi:DNA helicase-2/ATP-dependent DNA helicase PcrA
MDMVTRLGPELKILMDLPLSDIEKVSGGVIAEAIRRVREGKVAIAAGYDGEYGVVKIFDTEERKKIEGQSALF